MKETIFTPYRLDRLGIVAGIWLIPEDSNDDSLGRATDRLYEVGATEVFFENSLNIKNLDG